MEGSSPKSEIVAFFATKMSTRGNLEDFIDEKLVKDDYYKCFSSEIEDIVRRIRAKGSLEVDIIFDAFRALLEKRGGFLSPECLNFAILQVRENVQAVRLLLHAVENEQLSKEQYNPIVTAISHTLADSSVKGAVHIHLYRLFHILLVKRGDLIIEQAKMEKRDIIEHLLILVGLLEIDSYSKIQVADNISNVRRVNLALELLRTAFKNHKSASFLEFENTEREKVSLLYFSALSHYLVQMKSDGDEDRVESLNLLRELLTVHAEIATRAFNHVSERIKYSHNDYKGYILDFVVFILERHTEAMIPLLPDVWDMIRKELNKFSLTDDLERKIVSVVDSIAVIYAKEGSFGDMVRTILIEVEKHLRFFEYGHHSVWIALAKVLIGRHKVESAFFERYYGQLLRQIPLSSETGRCAIMDSMTDMLVACNHSPHEIDFGCASLGYSIKHAKETSKGEDVTYDERASSLGVLAAYTLVNPAGWDDLLARIVKEYEIVVKIVYERVNEVVKRNEDLRKAKDRIKAGETPESFPETIEHHINSSKDVVKNIVDDVIRKLALSVVSLGESKKNDVDTALMPFFALLESEIEHPMSSIEDFSVSSLRFVILSTTLSIISKSAAVSGFVIRFLNRLQPKATESNAVIVSKLAEIINLKSIGTEVSSLYIGLILDFIARVSSTAASEAYAMTIVGILRSLFGNRTFQVEERREFILGFLKRFGNEVGADSKLSSIPILTLAGVLGHTLYLIEDKDEISVEDAKRYAEAMAARLETELAKENGGSYEIEDLILSGMAALFNFKEDDLSIWIVSTPLGIARNSLNIAALKGYHAGGRNVELLEREFRSFLEREGSQGRNLARWLLQEESAHLHMKMQQDVSIVKMILPPLVNSAAKGKGMNEGILSLFLEPIRGFKNFEEIEDALILIFNGFFPVSKENYEIFLRLTYPIFSIGAGGKEINDRRIKILLTRAMSAHVASTLNLLLHFASEGEDADSRKQSLNVIAKIPDLIPVDNLQRETVSKTWKMLSSTLDDPIRSVRGAATECRMKWVPHYYHTG